MLLHSINVLFCNLSHLIRSFESLAGPEPQVVQNMATVGLPLTLIQVVFSLV